MDTNKSELTIGPILFHWPAEQKLDFYKRIADEAPVDTVYIGEVICSKRAPFFEEHYQEVEDRLEAAGKKVVYSTLAEVMLPRERKMILDMCVRASNVIGDGDMVEANDTSALYHLRGHDFYAGQYLNVYNEDTMELLAAKGAKHFTLPVELPGDSIAVLAAKAAELGVGIEVQVFGRMPLALSARCYHARSHGRIKNNCQFVCEEDCDGMDLKTLDGSDFLAINGIQTLSHSYYNLLEELPALQEMGVQAFRLSPHSFDMVEISKLYRDVLDGKSAPQEVHAQVEKLAPGAVFANGFFHSKKGYECTDIA